MGMANPVHVEILYQGIEAWNDWRRRYPEIKPDLSRTDLTDLALYTYENEVMLTSNLRHTDLRGTNLTGVDMKAANLEYSKLQNAILREAIMSDVKLVGANLRGADLTGAAMPKANLRGGDAKGACFKQAYLYGVYFENTNLCNVDFREADFEDVYIGENVGSDGADLRGVDLTRASGQREMFIQNAVTDQSTLL